MLKSLKLEPPPNWNENSPSLKRTCSTWRRVSVPSTPAATVSTWLALSNVTVAAARVTEKIATSLPAPPVSRSLPALPLMALAAEFPVMTSSNAVPLAFSITLPMLMVIWPAAVMYWLGASPK